jgi:cell division protein FtsW
MARTLKSDKVLFWAAVLLVCTSIVMVYSATALTDQRSGGTATLIRQLCWATLGIGTLLFTMRLDYHELRRPSLIWALIAVTAASLLAVFAFDQRLGARRWIEIGSLTWQPSELAKVVIILFAAALLERRMHRINELGYAIMPVAIVTLGLGSLILLEPDLGTPVVIVAAVLTIVFVSGLRYRHLLSAVLLMLPGLILLIVLYPHRIGRLMAFLHPEADKLGFGYQAWQSILAVGSGGLFGRGLMEGLQKVYYLPEANNDFIFAVIGEELGLIGTTLVLACFLVIAWRGLRAALLAPDRFGALLGIGLTTMMGVQALINMSVVLSLLPTKGLPLPLISAGGTSLVINLAAMGILLNISQHASPTAAAVIEAR